MKIAVILPSLAYTAPILVVRDIISQIYNKVDLIDVYYFDDIVEVEFNCPVHCIAISDKIDFEKYDIIHSHLYRPDKYVWKNRKRITGKKISTVHCHIGNQLRFEHNIFISLVFTRIWLLFLRTHDRIVVLTKSILNNYYKYLIPQNKLLYIYNGKEMPIIGNIDGKDLELITQLKGKNFKIIGANALLTKTKGLHLIIEVLPLLPDYVFVVCGDGKEKQNLMKLSHKLNVADRCYFLEFKKNATSYLPFYDVYAMPSFSEGFSLALAEATLLKRSCICSDIPILREIFTEDEVTFFPLNNNRQALKEAIEEAYQKRIEKGNNAYNRVSNNYTIEIMGSHYFDLYQSLK